MIDIDILLTDAQQYVCVECTELQISHLLLCYGAAEQLTETSKNSPATGTIAAPHWWSCHTRWHLLLLKWKSMLITF